MLGFSNYLSTIVDRLMSIAAAEKLLPVVLELTVSGNDPFIIADGAHLQDVHSFYMLGVFQNAGYNCTCVERVLVHESQKDELGPMTAEQIRQSSLGGDVGPITLCETVVKAVFLMEDCG